MERSQDLPWTVATREFELGTRGHDHILDITARVRETVRETGVDEGQAMVFVPGATASITTMEFEPGLVRDIAALFEHLMPFGRDWAHHRTWGDDNGGAHLRAMILGPSLNVPLRGGAPVLGTWQQIVLIDHDTRPRRRRVVVQVMGR